MLYDLKDRILHDMKYIILDITCLGIAKYACNDTEMYQCNFMAVPIF